MNDLFIEYCNTGNISGLTSILNKQYGFFSMFRHKERLDFETALVIACRNVNNDIIRLIYKYSSSIDSKIIVDCLSILCDSTNPNKYECVLSLVFFTPILKQCDLYILFYKAVYNSDYMLIHVLVSIKTRTDLTKNRNQLFKLAASKGNHNIVYTIYTCIKHNITGSDYHEFLIILMRHDYIDIFKTFVKDGNVNINTFGSLLYHSIVYKRADFFEYMSTLTGYIDNMPYLDKLVSTACAYNDVPALKYLLPNIQSGKLVYMGDTYYISDIHITGVTDDVKTVLNQYSNCIFEMTIYVGSDNICSICLDNDGELYSLKCGHVFHKNCIFSWYNKLAHNDISFNCPNCRST
jgi:hypothetical protein